MEHFLLLILVPLVVGVASNVVYGLICNYREYVKASEKHVFGCYKLYWYHSGNVRRLDDQRVSRATVRIFRTWLLRVAVTFEEDDLANGTYVGYIYHGTARLIESELHLVLDGQTHAETIYAIFGHALSKSIEVRCGLFLLTSNDKTQRPMSIRCFISRNEMSEVEARLKLGAKDFLVTRS